MTNHPIERLLKNDDLDARITCGDAWLVWFAGEWTVLSKTGRQKTKVQYVGDSLEDALHYLGGGK